MSADTDRDHAIESSSVIGGRTDPLDAPPAYDPTPSIRLPAIARWRRVLEWVILCLFTAALIVWGIQLALTGSQPFGINANQGPTFVSLIGYTMIAGGVALPVLTYLFGNRRNVLPSQLRWVAFIDVVYMLFLFLMLGSLFLWSFFEAQPRIALLVVGAVVATVFAGYKLVRIVLEHRIGISVASSGIFTLWSRNRPDVDFSRQTEPISYWWAMCHEALWVLAAAVIAGGLWVLLWQGLP
jgi:hypothetical protein